MIMSMFEVHMQCNDSAGRWGIDRLCLSRYFRERYIVFFVKTVLKPLALLVGLHH